MRRSTGNLSFPSSETMLVPMQNFREAPVLNTRPHTLTPIAEPALYHPHTPEWLPSPKR